MFGRKVQRFGSSQFDRSFDRQWSFFNVMFVLVFGTVVGIFAFVGYTYYRAMTTGSPQERAELICIVNGGVPEYTAEGAYQRCELGMRVRVQGTGR